MEVKYFNALLQIVMDYQIKLFDDEMLSRETLLRNTFERGCFIPAGIINDSGWGIGDTRYLTDERDWMYGFLHKVVDASNMPVLPTNATSLKELKHMGDLVVKMTPFFFNFVTQRIYTQSHWAITRSSNSASEIWKSILYHLLKNDVLALDVQSITEKESFWDQLNTLRVINTAEFDLFGPNILNDQRIRELIQEFHPTGTLGLSFFLKNFINGLKLDAKELQGLIDYVLRGGGKGKFKGIEKKTNNVRIVKTEQSTVTIQVSRKLDESSSETEIKVILEEIYNKESTSA